MQPLSVLALRLPAAFGMFGKMIDDRLREGRARKMARDAGFRSRRRFVLSERLPVADEKRFRNPRNDDRRNGEREGNREFPRISRPLHERIETPSRRIRGRIERRILRTGRTRPLLVRRSHGRTRGRIRFSNEPPSVRYGRYGRQIASIGTLHPSIGVRFFNGIGYSLRNGRIVPSSKTVFWIRKTTSSFLPEILPPP